MERVVSGRERRLFLAVFLVAATLASSLFGDIDNRSLDLMRALERGQLRIDRDAANTYDKAFIPRSPSTAGVALGSPAPASALSGGHYYCGAAPGPAFFTFPVYLLAKRLLPARCLEVALVVFAGALMLALGAVGVARAVERGSGCSEEAATLAALIHALATIALPYATRFYTHSLVLACFSWSLALLLRRRDREGPPRVALAGLLAGLAVLHDYNALFPVFTLGLLALVVRGPRGGVAFALGGLPAAATLAVYQKACFGSPWTTPYDHHADPHIAWIYAQGNHGFTAPSPRLVLEIVFGLRRGWLWTQPAVFLGLLGLVATAKSSGDPRGRRIALVALATALVTLLANAGRATDWDAGAGFGARYTMTALPFVALGYPRGIALAGRAARPIVAASFALALVGSVSSWSFSIVESVAQLFAFGPNLRGAARVLLGTDPHTVTVGTALVSAAGLSCVLAGVPLLLGFLATSWSPRAVRALRITLIALPWLVAAPFLLAAFWSGTARAVEERQRAVGILETRHIIRDASEASHARALMPAVHAVSVSLGAPELDQALRERIADLERAADPGR